MRQSELAPGLLRSTLVPFFVAQAMHKSKRIAVYALLVALLFSSILAIAQKPQVLPPPTPEKTAPRRLRCPRR